MSGSTLTPETHGPAVSFWSSGELWRLLQEAQAEGELTHRGVVEMEQLKSVGISLQCKIPKGFGVLE